MITRRSLVSTLSVWRAAVVQQLDGSWFASTVLQRVVPGQFVRLRPRDAAGRSEADLDLGRPIRLPQVAWGTMLVPQLPPPGSTALARLVRRARRRRRTVLGPAVVDRPESLLVLAASGAPVTVDDPTSSVSGALGAELAKRICLPVGDDARSRELHSIRVRRLAHDRLWHRAKDPAASVLLATRRPDFLGAAIRQVRDQTGVDVQVVVGLHGDGFPSADGEALRQLPHGSIVERFDTSVSLGEVLNSLTERADADLVTKWDDDDWYGSEHLADLVRAHEYSGADVVGKGSEFVWLERSDVTIRRFAVGAESYSWTLAGGTLLMSRSWLDAVGGWPAVPVGVDHALLAATRAAGGTAYRTHGFEYVLRRHAEQSHTWAAVDAHFLDAAGERRPGLDLGFAGFEASREVT